MDPWKNGLMGKQIDKHSYRLAIFNYNEEKKRKEKRKQKYLIKKKDTKFG